MIQAAGALFYSRTSNRFLFVQRDNDAFPNYWGLVGGKVEQNETINDALIREIQEEIGFLPQFMKVIPLDTFLSPDKNFQYNTFVCAVISEFIPTLNDEHKGYAWTKISNPPKPLHPGLYNTLNVDEIQKKISIIESLNPAIEFIDEKAV